MNRKLNITLHKILQNVDEPQTIFDMYEQEAETIIGTMLSHLKNQSCELRVFLDDGYACHYDFARGIKEKFGLHSVLGIVTNDVGKDGYLSWAQISELASSGHTIASHGVSHAALGEYTGNVVMDTPQNGRYGDTPKGRGALLSEPEVSYQVVESGKVFETKGIGASSFVYPYGIYNAQIIEIVRRSRRYTSAYTCDGGIETEKADPFVIPRIVLDNSLPADEWVPKLIRLVQS